MRNDLPTVLQLQGNTQFVVWMSKPEIDLFMRTLAFNNREPYLEFGMGGSTLIAASMYVPTISVDNQPQYINQVLIDIAFRKLPEPRVHFANQGEVKEWGYPVSLDPVPCDRYSDEVWFLFNSKPFPKTIFIDGRYRNACLLRTLLYCPFPCDVLLHDCNRPAYQTTLKKFFDVEHQVDELMHLRRKTNIFPLEVHQQFEATKFDPS